jgi:hypothetical protein
MALDAIRGAAGSERLQQLQAEQLQRNQEMTQRNEGRTPEQRALREQESVERTQPNRPTEYGKGSQIDRMA